MKVLLVEDSVQLNKALTTLLRRNSYIVDSAFDGEEALLFLKDYQYDVIVLDIMLPKIDGLEVLSRARRNKILSPVIMLTAKSSIEDKIMGLDIGADDYLAKPFNSDELLARIRALGRRPQNLIDKSEIIFNDLIINENTSSLKCGEKTVILSKKELEILLLLIQNKGNIVSAEKIAEKAWDEESFSTNENVWVFISFLRKKLENIGSKTQIKTKRYQGYYLETKNA